MGIYFDFWPIPRPMTKTWGSGKVWDRLCENVATPDIAFGKTDGIPEGIQAVDQKNGYQWNDLPFEDNQFEFGYWDPPYDKLYRPECIEIWRTCRKLAILHTHVYPTSWMKNARRVGMVAVTMGPLKQIRVLQIFEKSRQMDLMTQEDK